MNSISTKIVLAALAISFAHTAMAVSPETPIHGPESNARLDLRQTYPVYVAPGGSVEFYFYSSAHYENEVNIYDDHGQRLVRRGNKKFGLKSWRWRNNSAQTRLVLISAWHKRGAWAPNRPWRQSPMRVFQQGVNGAVGFEDSVDNNFNDVVVRYRVAP